MDEKPRRRWFRFSLRTMFVLVTVFALWLGWNLHWVRQRRDFLRQAKFRVLVETPNAHSLFWLFGESRVEAIILLPDDASALEEARRLFPEAQIEVGLDPVQ